MQSNAIDKINPHQNKLMKQEQILDLITTGQVTTISELAEKCNLTISNASRIMNDPQIISALQNYSKANVSIKLHQRAIPRLMEIAESEDEKTAMQAIKMLGSITGDMKSNNGNDVNVNVNLGNLLDEVEREKNITPKDLGLSEVIDIS